MAFAKIRRNGQWVDYWPQIRQNGQWHDAKTRVRQNGQWVDIPGRMVRAQRVAEFPATWTCSYYSDRRGNRQREWWGAIGHGNPYLVQGRYSPNHDTYDTGDQHSMIGFDDNAIRNTIKGSDIDSIQIYMKCVHTFYYGMAARAVFGWHNSRQANPSFGWENEHGMAWADFRRWQGRWVNLPNWFGDRLRDNSATGVTIKADNLSNANYCIFDGTNGDRPRLRITYTHWEERKQ